MSGDMFAYGRFGIAAMLIIGGIAAIFWGYRLFLHGAGLSKGIDKLDLKSDWGKVSFAGMSVGCALMVTSVFWGGFAYLSVPKLELAANSTKITEGPASVNTSATATASAVGATIVGKDKSTVGTIEDVIMASPTQAAGYVVDLEGSKTSKVFLGADTVTWGVKPGTASVQLTQDQLYKLKPVSKVQEKWQLQLAK
jgi:hypothetical protein